jgi:hypothetical protein
MCLRVVAIVYAISRVHVKQHGLKINGTLHRLVYADDVIYFDEASIL